MTVENGKFIRKVERKTVLIGVHCNEVMVDALDSFIADQYAPMPRPEAIRVILAEALGRSDYLPRAGQSLKLG